MAPPNRGSLLHSEFGYVNDTDLIVIVVIMELFLLGVPPVVMVTVFLLVTVPVWETVLTLCIAVSKGRGIGWSVTATPLVQRGQISTVTIGILLVLRGLIITTCVMV